VEEFVPREKNRDSNASIVHQSSHLVHSSTPPSAVESRRRLGRRHENHTRARLTRTLPRAQSVYPRAFASFASTRASPALVPKRRLRANPFKRRLSIDHRHESNRVKMTRVRRAVCAASLVSLACALVARVALASESTHVFYYNDVTQESRWDDPDGLATYQDDDGRDFWVDVDTGESTYESPFEWMSAVSEDPAHSGQKYYINKRTKESTWDRPQEFAWRRIEQAVDAHEKYTESESEENAEESDGEL
jgi:hypothetical protein